MSWKFDKYSIGTKIIPQPGLLVEIVTCEKLYHVTMSRKEGYMTIMESLNNTLIVSCTLPGEKTKTNCILLVKDLDKMEPYSTK